MVSFFLQKEQLGAMMLSMIISLECSVVIHVYAHQIPFSLNFAGIIAICKIGEQTATIV